MDIRSVTLFTEPEIDSTFTRQFFESARRAFHVPVQTSRMATTPFPDWWDSAVEMAVQVHAFVDHCQQVGADYISLGPVQLRHDAAWLAKIPEIIAGSEFLFASVEIADLDGQIDTGRCHGAATIIRQISTIQDNGFGNLYLAALANCPPGSPFFPVAYHGGGPAHFALAVEAADLALTAVQSANSLAEARRNLVRIIEDEAARLEEPAQQLAQEYGLTFSGLDFSLAPFPAAAKSLAGAMEAFGLPWLGAPGSLFTAAFITEAIGRADFARCGFSGLMLPVLEDSVLAARTAEGRLAVSDLLGYAAVCGVGLDTVPLAGDVPAAVLAGVLLDVAALATRLNKPLTARLMPLPGLSAGDPVHFDFPYFADSRVMRLAGPGNGRLLAGSERLELDPYGDRG